MNLQYRIDLLVRLGQYILNNDPEWQEAKEKASRENGWFIPSFVDLSTNHIAGSFLQKDQLDKWINQYQLPITNHSPKKVGIVMAGNIPLVGFHDLLAVFITGHIAFIKTSSKDDTLVKHVVAKLVAWEPEVEQLLQFGEMLKGCDAYIATGSNNSAGYFEYYFGRFPHIIRRNRTSVAILTGNETTAELEKLADDVYLYFGLGCRNVTKLYVPEGYNFISLINTFKKYDYLADHHKYKNNYDYNLALHLLNKKYYMSNPSLLLIEDPSFFSPISQLNYEFYSHADKLTDSLKNHPELQCIVGKGLVPFGQSQFPAVSDYADGVDTLQFLSKL
jgi:hypothetical protein